MGFEEEKAMDGHMNIMEYVQSPRLPRKLPPLSVVNPIVELTPPITEDEEEEEEEEEEETASILRGRQRKWPTSWYWQLLVLTVRTFRQSRHVLLSKLNFIQTLCLAVVVSFIWFQVPREEQSISDRYGVVSVVKLVEFA